MGLSRRIVLTSVLVGLLAVAAYALLFIVIVGLRDSARVTSHSRAVLASSNRLERLVTDLETSVRGFVLSNSQAGLRLWGSARAEVPSEEATFRRLAARSGPHQAARAGRIVRDTDAYVRDYSVPLVAAIRQDPASGRARALIGESGHRLEPIRKQFRNFVAVERRIADSAEANADREARRAAIVSGIAAAGALVLTFSFAGYLRRAVLRPVTRTSRMARAITEGDLDVRIPETSWDEPGVLERTFNIMTSSLRASQDELRRVVDEQGALRRVATLVAHGVPPSEIFDAVAGELGRLQGVDYSVVNRFDPDRVATSVGHWTAPGAPDIMPPMGGRWPLEEGTVGLAILQAGEPTRVDLTTPISQVGRWSSARGVRYVVGCPIVADGHIWGMIATFSIGTEKPADDTEANLREFVELVSAAIVNAGNRDELLASTARIVAASDRVRAGIEADLREGAQRRLVSLRRELRKVRNRVPACHGDLRERLAGTETGLNYILGDLREISQGLRPVAVAESGLRPAVEALAARSRVPVVLDVRVGRRLTGHIEDAVYYTVAEALTNVAKYARASLVRVELTAEGADLRLVVRDDGVGGADPRGGSGLTGLRERVEACGGTIEIDSPPGEGTTLLVTIPIAG